MRMDAFLVILCTLLASLVLLIFSYNTYLSDVAYIGALLSVALFTVDDLVDNFFMALIRVVTALKRYQVHQASFSFLRHKPHPFKARQRWLNEHRIKRFAYRSRKRHAI